MYDKFKNCKKIVGNSYGPMTSNRRSFPCFKGGIIIVCYHRIEDVFFDRLREKMNLSRGTKVSEKLFVTEPGIP